MKISLLIHKLEKLKGRGLFDKASEIANDLGHLFSACGKYEESLKYHREDQELCRSLGDKEGEAEAYRNISEVQVNKGDYDASLTTIKECLNLVKKNGDLINEERCYVMIAYTYITKYTNKVLRPEEDNERLLDKAMKMLTKCTEMHGEPAFRRLSDCDLNQKKGRAFTNQSNILCLRGDVKGALVKLQEAERVMSKHRNELHDDLHTLFYSTASYMISLDARLFEKHSDEALKLADKSVKALRKKDRKYVEASMTRAKILILKGRPMDAKEILMEAHEHLQNFEPLNTMIKVVQLTINEEESLLKHPGRRHKPLEKIADAICRLKEDFPLLEQTAYCRMAIDYYQKSLSALKLVQHTDAEVAALQNSIAQCHYEAREFGQALKKFNEVFELEKGDPSKQCATISHIVDILLATEASEDSIIDKYREWEQLAGQAGSTYQKAISLQEHEEYLRKSNKPQEADKVRRRKLAILVEVGLGEDEVHELEPSQASQEGGITDVLAGIEIERETTKRNTKSFKFKAIDKEGNWILHKMVKEKGRDEEIKRVLRQGHPVDVKDNIGWTPLGDAMELGYLSYVQALVKGGADINRRQIKPDEDTPVILAAKSCHLDIVDYLAQVNADVTLRNNRGLTALAFLRGHLETEARKPNGSTSEIERSIRLLEDKTRKLGKTVDHTIASDADFEDEDETFSSARSSAYNTFEELRLKRNERASKTSSARNLIADAARSRQSSSTIKSSRPPTNISRPSAARAKLMSKSSDEENRTPKLNSKRIKRVSSSSSDDDDTDCFPRPGPRKSVFTSTQIVGSRPEELPSIPLLSQIQRRQESDRFVGPSQSLPDISPPPHSHSKHKPKRSSKGEEFEEVSYPAVMEQLKRFNKPQPTSPPEIPTRSGQSDDSGSSGDNVILSEDDWLEDDLGAAKKKRKKRSEDNYLEKKRARSSPFAGPGSSLPAGPSGQSGHLVSPVSSPRSVTVDSAELLVPSPPTGPRSPVLRRSQERSPSPLRQPSPPPRQSKLTKRKKSYQPKITHALARAVSPSLQPVHPSYAGGVTNTGGGRVPYIPSHPAAPPPAVAASTPAHSTLLVTVQINDFKSRIPVRDRQLTVGWLSQEASRRYETSKGDFPVIKLTAGDGAQLAEDDLIQDVVIGQETLRGNVVSWQFKPQQQANGGEAETAHEGFKTYKNITKLLLRAETTNCLKINIPLKEGILHQISRSPGCLSILTELSMAGCRLSSNIDQFAKLFQTMRRLEVADLSQNSLLDSMLGGLQALPPNLTTLNLSYNFFHLQFLKFASPLFATAPRLRILNLSHSTISEASFRQSSRSEFARSIKGLRELNISGNELGPRGVSLLLECCPRSLHSLDISSTMRSEVVPGKLDGLLTFCAQGDLIPSLRTLNLGNCRLSDESLPDLVKITNQLACLTRLDLSWNPVSGQMVASLVVSLAQAGIKLTGLVLNNCHNLANKGFEDLVSSLNKLETLNLLSFPDVNTELSSSLKDSWRQARGRAGKEDMDASNNIILSGAKEAL